MRRCKKCGDDKPLTEFPKRAKDREAREWACKVCKKARQLCGYCGRETTQWKRSVDGDGFECRYESDCVASRRPGHRRLVRHGTQKVLDTLGRHDWNLTAAGKELGVTGHAVGHHLKKHAPTALARVHEAFLRRIRQPRKIHSREHLLQVLRVCQYRMARVARAMDHDHDTIRRALIRLAPEIYARLPELRRSTQCSLQQRAA